MKRNSEILTSDRFGMAANILRDVVSKLEVEQLFDLIHNAKWSMSYAVELVRTDPTSALREAREALETVELQEKRAIEAERRQRRQPARKEK